MRDVSRLNLPADRLLAEALPSTGRWIASLGPHRLPQIADQLSDAGFLDDALAYAARLDALSGTSNHQVSLKSKAARRLSQQGDISGAIAQLQEALRLNPDAAVVHMELGTIYGRKNDLRKAVQHLSQAVRLDPEGLPDAHLNLGVALRRMGKIDEAVDSLLRALTIDPRHPHTRTWR